MSLDNYLHLTSVVVSAFSSVCVAYFSYTIYKTSEQKRQNDLFKIRYEFIKELESEITYYAWEEIFPDPNRSPDYFDFIIEKFEHQSTLLENKAGYLFNKEIKENVAKILKNKSEYLKVIHNMEEIVADDIFWKVFEKYLKLEK